MQKNHVFFLKMSWVVPESCLPTIIFQGRTVKFRGCSRKYDAYCRCFSFCLLKAGCVRKNTEVSLPSFRETSVDEQPKDSWKQQFTPLGSHFLQSFQIIKELTRKLLEDFHKNPPPFELGPLQH